MAENGWDQMKRVVEYRLDNYDRRLALIDDKLDEILVNQARLDERSGRKAALTGAITGFLAGLTGWLR
jgi:hypothetical protein